jgi:hypothetical protein
VSANEGHARLSPTRPLKELLDDELVAELSQLLATRIDTLRHGSTTALANSTARMEELEAEYVHRHPQREVSTDRLRPA